MPCVDDIHCHAFVGRAAAQFEPRGERCVLQQQNMSAAYVCCRVQCSSRLAVAEEQCINNPATTLSPWLLSDFSLFNNFCTFKSFPKERVHVLLGIFYCTKNIKKGEIRSNHGLKVVVGLFFHYSSATASLE